MINVNPKEIKQFINKDNLDIYKLYSKEFVKNKQLVSISAISIL